MPKIFISYRRQDSIGITGRIFDRLVDTFGKENVFQDVITIPPGVDFRKYLQNEIARCDVILVIIGRLWAGIEDEQGHKRLFNPVDFVRIEVESGIKQGKWVIPVLVDNATMPYAEELPESLHDIGYLNAIQVRHNPDFHNDMNRLIEAIKDYSSMPRSLTEHAGDQVRKILPEPFEWCDVSGGNVLLNDETSYKAPGKNGGQYQVDSFAIAKYPVTKAQYGIFTSSSDGYRETKWWDYSTAAKVWRTENPDFKATALTSHLLPCTNITWYEAIAFCRWLSYKTGLNVRLPTEIHWQRAALGDTGWAYPWGNQFNESRCNYTITQLTPVTQYISGASPYGVMDMAGNVWEWCLSEWDDDLRNLEDGNLRVMRGGSWPKFHPKLLRAETRIWIPASERLQDGGFRCALIP